MNLRVLRVAAWSLLAIAAACAQIVRAHEFKLDAVINAFVKIEPGEAQLVIRAPLYLFKSAKFPVNNIEIDVRQVGTGGRASPRRVPAGHRALRK